MRFSVPAPACAHGVFFGGSPGRKPCHIDMARNYGYNYTAMDISVAKAKNRLSELIRAVEDGDRVVITRHGKPVARLTPPPPKRRRVRLGAMKDRIGLKPGWDAPVDPDAFLAGDL